MGFFSGIRRRIKKIIPKEIRPALPFIAAALPFTAPAGLGALGSKGALGSFLRASATKAATDDEAGIKDILRTGAIAASPQILDAGIGKLAAGDGRLAEMLNATKTLKDGTETISFADKISSIANPETFTGGAKLVGAQAATDFGIKQAELNEKALEEYNANLLSQGITNKANRRSAIFSVFTNAGYNDDEVNDMLDKYGYRSGGRVGHADGDMVLTNPSNITPERRNQIEGSQEAERAFNIIFERFVERFPGIATGEESLEDMIAMLQAEEVAGTEGTGILGMAEGIGAITPESVDRSTRRIMRGDTQYGDVPGFKKGGKTEKFDEGFEYAKQGLEALEDLDDEYEPLPIRELRLAKGGEVMDMNMKEQIDTPSGDMMMDENIKMTSDPNSMDELNSLSLDMFGKPLFELSEDEFESLKDLASQQALKPGLIDDYRNYKYQMEEQGITPMSPRDYFRNEFGAARLGVKKGGPVEININAGGNNMEDIKGQTAGPDWYQERIENLEFLFGDELTDEEIADIAYDSDKYYDKVGYEPGLKKGGKVIKIMPEGVLYKGKAKDYPGIKQLIKDMKKKGTRNKKADGGSVTFEEFLEMRQKEDKERSRDMLFKDYEEYKRRQKVKEEKTMAKDGGLMSMGGNELDLRGGGFVPMGKKERADDVPARLSKNEFVMTADAVRAAGGGSVQKGADLMYDTMKKLEAQS